jgi:lysophospholipase L1-like esterase
MAPTPPALHDAPVSIPQFLLFGDSITQCSTLTLQAYLQTAYIRRFDVLNRGFSGYTAPLGLHMLKRFLSKSALSPGAPQVKVLTLFFGANDSTADLPHLADNQHVSLGDFETALREIVGYEVLKAHGTKVILITPPPIDEHQLDGTDMRRGRTAENTARYSAAVRDLAKELNVPVVDCWSLFMKKAGWAGNANEGKSLPGSLRVEQSNVLVKLLSDGLHLTTVGYELLYHELMRVIEQDLPQLAPTKLPLVLGKPNSKTQFIHWHN